MLRFILQENIAHFERVLQKTRDERDQQTVRQLLFSARRGLAVLDSTKIGAPSGPRRLGTTRGFAGFFQEKFENSWHPCLILDPYPGLHIVDINRAYADATMTTQAAVSGRPLFEVFPDNPADPNADGVSNLFASLQWAARTRHPHAMPIQRYDVRNPDGKFIERYWRPVNSPIFDQDGDLVYLLHQVIDVTTAVGVSRPFSDRSSLNRHTSFAG